MQKLWVLASFLSSVLAFNPMLSPKNLQAMGHAATVEALDIKTVPAKMGPFWFQQPLDHFNKSETRTLKQRYWVNQQWYAKGGPVIFYNAGEAPADERSNFVLNSSMALVAQELQGVVVVLEHRMYGQSRPSDDKDLLNYLNTNQSLADMANIALSGNSLQNFPSGKMAPPDTKWVVYGGSYSGNLAAWLRLKYPNVFSAAIASSAPVQAGYDFYQYFDPIGNYGPSSCIKPMTSINGYVNQVLSGKNTAAKLKLKNQFGLGNLQDDDFASVLSTPLGFWQSMSPTSNPFADQFCPIFDNATTLDAQIKAFGDYVVAQQWCGDNNDYCNSHNQTSGFYTGTDFDTLAWVWCTCKEYAYWQVGEPRSDNVQLVSRALTTATNERQCAYFFNGMNVPKRAPVSKTNNIYEGWHIKTSRTIFIDGEWDPWRGLSVQSPHAPHKPVNTTDLKYVFLPQSVHHWDFFVGPNVAPAINASHAFIVDTLKEWLK